MDTPVDPCRCPLCGASNDCAMARGDDARCWCASVAIDRAVLATIPPDAQGKACICARCAAAGRAIDSDPA